MKRFFCSVLLTILAFTCFSQDSTYKENTYQQLGAKKTHVKVLGALSADSAMKLPADTLRSALNNSLAIKNGVVYKKVSGVWVTSEGSGGGGDSTLQQVTEGNKNITANSIKIVKKDSVGEIFGHDWTGAFGSTLLDQTSTATLTASSGKTTINGTLGRNLNNRITYPIYLAANNMTIRLGRFVVTQLDGTSYGFGFMIEGTVGSAPNLFADFYLTDTSKYISYTSAGTLPVYSTSINNRQKSTFKMNLGDTLQPIITKIGRNVYIRLINEQTGAEMRLDVPECTVTVGLAHIYFYSQVEMVGRYSIEYNEIYKPNFVWFTDSNGWMVTGKEGESFVDQTMARLGGSYVFMGAPFERALEGTLKHDALAAIEPDYLVYNYGVNQDANIDSFSKRVCRTVEFSILLGIDSIYLAGLVPQTATNVTTRNDTLKAIAARYPRTRYIEASIPLMGSSGTAMDPAFNSGDNVHINLNGATKNADTYYNNLKHLVMPDPPLVASPLPIGYDALWDVRYDRFNKFVRVMRDSVNSFLKNIRPVAGISNAQYANINAIGEFVFNNGPTGIYRIIGNGNFANPNVKVEAGVLTVAGNFVCGNFAISSSQPNFSSGNVFWGGGAQLVNSSTFKILANNPAGNGMTDGLIVDNATTDYTLSTSRIQSWKKNGTKVAAVYRDGNAEFQSLYLGASALVPREVLDVDGVVSIRTVNGAAAASVDSVAVIEDGRVKALVGFFPSGTYTPTASGATGGTVVSVEKFIYQRNGTTVSFSGYVSIDPTADGSIMQFFLTLPAASNFASDYDASGTLGCVVAGSVGQVQSDATADKILVSFVGGTGSTAGLGIRITGHYQIL